MPGQCARMQFKAQSTLFCYTLLQQVSLEHEILLHPRYFGPSLLNIVKQKLFTEVEGTCTGKYVLTGWFYLGSWDSYRKSVRFSKLLKCWQVSCMFFQASWHLNAALCWLLLTCVAMYCHWSGDCSIWCSSDFLTQPSRVHPADMSIVHTGWEGGFNVIWSIAVICKYCNMVSFLSARVPSSKAKSAPS